MKAIFCTYGKCYLKWTFLKLKSRFLISKSMRALVIVVRRTFKQRISMFEIRMDFCLKNFFIRKSD